MSTSRRTVSISINDLIATAVLVIGGVVLLQIVWSVALPIPTVPSFGDGVYLYVFGSSSCPYCRSLEDFFSKEYAGRYYFCAVCKYCLSYCAYTYEEIEKLLVGKGVSTFYLQFVPQTYVVVDGKYLTAVVVGGITEPQFWENITRREPGESVLFVVPPATFEIPMTHEEQAKLINTLASPETRNKVIEMQLSFVMLAVCIAVLGYFILRKW